MPLKPHKVLDVAVTAVKRCAFLRATGWSDWGVTGPRIKDQWRLCFAWRDGHAWEVEIVDYH